MYFSLTYKLIFLAVCTSVTWSLTHLFSVKGDEDEVGILRKLSLSLLYFYEDNSLTIFNRIMDDCFDIFRLVDFIFVYYDSSFLWLEYWSMSIVSLRMATELSCNGFSRHLLLLCLLLLLLLNELKKWYKQMSEVCKLRYLLKKMYILFCKVYILMSNRFKCIWYYRQKWR